MKPPGHLDARARRVWRDLEARGLSLGECSLPAAEALCVQVVRMRDAQGRVDEEGELVAGARERPEPHPALAIERAAGIEVRRWIAHIREELRVVVDAGGDKQSDPLSGLDELASRRSVRA